MRLIGLNRLHEDVIGHVPLATLDSAFFQYLMHPKYRAGSPAVKRADGPRPAPGLARSCCCAGRRSRRSLTRASAAGRRSTRRAASRRGRP